MFQTVGELFMFLSFLFSFHPMAVCILFTLSSLFRPPDFFDAGQVPSDTDPTEEGSKTKIMADILPEGFFDDPKLDAKVKHLLIVIISPDEQSS